MTMRSGSSRHVIRTTFTRTPLRVATFAVANALCTLAFSQQPTATGMRAAPSGSPRITAIEKQFWACDYVATTRGMQATPVDVCSAATEALKNERFGGDFELLLRWWRENKPGEHARLAGGDGAAQLEYVDSGRTTPGPR